MINAKRISLGMPQADLSVCAHANLRKAMRVVAQAYDAALKPSGLKATQFTLLAVLSRRGALPLTKLADLLVLDRTTLTRNLQPLQAKGWVETGREADERIRLIEITDAGRAVVDDAMPRWSEAQRRITEAVGAERLAAMIGDLNAVVDAIRPE